MTGDRRFVAVANGSYASARALPRAGPDSAEVAQLLEQRHGYRAVVLTDLPRGRLRNRIDEELAPGSLPGGSLIVMWTGHGRPDADEVYLIGAPDPAGGAAQPPATDPEVATPGELARWAARTGARQVFLLLDVCYAGGGVPDVIRRAAAVFNQRADTSRDWFGVFAACRPDELALSGALAGELRRLLRDGPATRSLRSAWLAAGTEIPADALFTALTTEWSQDRQTPQPAQLGTAGPMLRNPVLPGDWTEGVVEHLLVAARGTSTAANYFVGREGPLHAVVAWLGAGEPGLMLITGPPGCGKSALLGRVVSLADPTERAEILELGPVPGGCDPGAGAVDAHLHARSLRMEQAVEQLCAQLRLPADGGVYALLAAAAGRRAEGRPLVVAVDGLDEAGPLDAPALATKLLVPLAAEARVLVASRPVVGAEEAATLLGSPGRPVELLDLGGDAEATLRDVGEYVRRRLAGVAPEMAPEPVAREILAIARGADARRDGPFLLARLLTSQLRADPVDTGAPGWRGSLARSVGAALEHDLDRTGFEVEGRARPTAARELLTALAYACGEGFPADDELWPSVATALSPTGTRYGRADVAALLHVFGRHIVVGRERDRAVFRVAHQRLVEYLLGSARSAADRPEPLRTVATAVHDAYRARLAAGEAPDAHAYLWRYAWRHCADAGPEGLALLRGLVEADRAAFLPDLAMALDRAADRALDAGDVAAAVEHQTEAVAIERDLRPGGSPELCLALFDLALVLNMAGRSAEANSTADEATEIAWRFADEPHGAAVVSGALYARALARRSVGDHEAASRFAAEAAAILAADPDTERHAAASAARTVLAENLVMLGRLEEAEAAAGQAVDDVEAALATADRAPDELGTLSALSVQALAQLALWQQYLLTGRAGAEPPLSAAPRLLALVEHARPDGAVQALSFSDALRLVCATFVLAGDRSGLTDPDRARRCLERAVALALPHATSGPMGATVYAQAAQLLAHVAPDAADPATVEAVLRPFAEHDARAAAQLAGIELQHAGDESRPLAERVEHAAAAADLLAVGRVAQLQGLRFQALFLLWQLALRAGDRDLALRALEEASEVLEATVPPLPGRDRLLGMALAERSALLADGRAVEATALGERAVAVLRALPPDDAIPLMIAQTELNLGVIASVRNRPQDAAAAWDRALALLDGDERPAARALRGQVLGNLVRIRLAAGTVDDAVVADARAALALLREDRTGLNMRAVPEALLRLARVLHAAGAPGARDVARQAAQALVAHLRRTPDLVLLAVLSEAGADEPVWAELDEHAAEVARWPLPRAVLPDPRPDGLDAAVVELVAALAADDRAVRNVLRQMARRRRGRDPARFDAAWTGVTGAPVPDWFDLDDARIDLVVGWWNTPTWGESRDFLAAHPELLDADTEVYLDETADDSPELLAIHRDLLRAAREGTAGPAFDRLIAAGLVADWAGADDPVEFLDRRGDEVPPDVLAEVLAEAEPPLPVQAAVLTLFRTGERALAARIMHERVPWPELLEAAWRGEDAERLRALAVLCACSERSDDDDRALAQIAHAVAFARGDRLEDALADLREARAKDGAHVPRWRDAVADAIAYDQGDPRPLARLLAELR